jgi:hypothetical protein
MEDPKQRVCGPVEMELLPLYREPAWLVKLRRQQRRAERRQRRAERQSAKSGLGTRRQA